MVLAVVEPDKAERQTGPLETKVLLCGDIIACTEVDGFPGNRDGFSNSLVRF